MDGINLINPLQGPRGAADQVANRLREAIVSGHLAPGTRLPEARLAAQLGVSRIPVREALSRLEAEGLVKREPYRGTMVAKLSPEQVAESFMLRSLLEGFAVRLATPYITAQDMDRLRYLVEEIRLASHEGRNEDLPPLHREFHSTIYLKSGSEKLVSWIEELYMQFPKNLGRTFRFTEPVEEYLEIIRAMESRDAELAGKLMSDHITRGGPMAVRYYSEDYSGDQATLR